MPKSQELGLPILKEPDIVVDKILEVKGNEKISEDEAQPLIDLEPIFQPKEAIMDQNMSLEVEDAVNIEPEERVRNTLVSSKERETMRIRILDSLVKKEGWILRKIQKVDMQIDSNKSTNDEVEIVKYNQKKVDFRRKWPSPGTK